MSDQAAEQGVAPREGAWIEILRTRTLMSRPTSRPVRARGLKSSMKTGMKINLRRAP